MKIMAASRFHTIIAYILVVVFWTILGSACRETATSTPGLVVEYLRATSDRPFPQTQLVVVLQDGICGTCTTETLEFLERSLQQTNCEVRVLLPRPNPQIETRLTLGPNPPQIVLGDPILMERYGLRAGEDALYVVAGDSLTAWSKLSDGHLPAARKLLSKYSCPSPLVDH